MEMDIHSPLSYLSASDWLSTVSKGGRWTTAENKMFEKALAIHDKDTPDRWQKIVDMIPGKSLDEVKRHYRDLEEDVSHIEAGLIPIPGYTSSPFTLEWVDRRGVDGIRHGNYGKRSGVRASDQERKKGVPWTEEEHRSIKWLFLMGLNKYGKGDWRNISRNFVMSRTPTQVASHAQKYFIRLSSGGKDKRRSSIHDITTVNLPEERAAASLKPEGFLGAAKEACALNTCVGGGRKGGVVKRECQDEEEEEEEEDGEEDVSFRRLQSFQSRRLNGGTGTFVN